MKRWRLPRKPLQRLTLLYSLAICGIIVTAGMGRLPVKAFLARFPWGDKAGHFLLIGMLAYLIHLSLSEAPTSRLWKANLVLLVVVVGEEISQVWMSYRAFEVADLMADFAGILCFSALAHWQRTRRRRALPAPISVESDE